ncbi:MAG: OmpH family outer membrane protein [Candidatus Bipolaricaulota bacterium]
MTRVSLVLGAVALVLAAGALVLHFATSSGAGGVSPADLNALAARVSSLEASGVSGQSLKVGYIDVDAAFVVFTNAVSDLRERSTQKRNEIVTLQNSYLEGTVSKDQYQRRLNELNTELLDAQLASDVGTLDRMIASSSFADLRSDLQRLREQAQSIVDEAKNLVSMAKGGAIDPTEFQSRLAQVQSAFTQLDQVVTTAAVAKIQQAAQRVAIQRGFDLVVAKKNVIAYSDPSAVTDITEFVKTEIANYL